MAVAWGEVDVQRGGEPRKFDRITVHDTATGSEIRTIAIPMGTPIAYKVSLALSPDGDTVAMTGPNFEVRVYPVGNAGDPVVLGTLDRFVSAIAFHPDGKSLAACGKRFAAIWDLQCRSERVRILQPSDRGLWDLAFSPDGRYLATVSDDAVGRLWDARSGRELSAVPAQTGLGLSVAFSPRGDCFAVGATSVSVIAIEGGRERRTETSPTNVSMALVFDPARPRLFHCGANRQLYEWRLDEAVARPSNLPKGLNPSILRIAPGGREFVVGWHPYNDTKPGADYSICIWARDDLAAQRRLIGSRAAVDSIDLVDDGRRIAAGSKNGGLYVWDFQGGTLLFRKELGAMAPSLHGLDDSGLLVAAGRRLLLLSAEDGAVRRELTLPQTAAAFVVTPDRKEALVATVDGAIHRVLLPGLEIKRSRQALNPDTWRRMAISPDGSLVAVTTLGRGRALLLDAETLEPVAMMPGQDVGRLNFLVFDPKGRYFAFGVSHISLWDLALVRDELAPLGLAWGRAAPPTIPPPDPAEAAERENLAEVESKARGLFQSGLSAFREGRFQDAAVGLREAAEQFGALRTSFPNDSALVRLHAISLGLLACSLRDSKRPGEALTPFRESLTVYESLGNPNPGDLYNMACGCAMVSALDGQGSPEDREKFEARAVEYLRRAIAGNTAQILPLVATSRSLDPLRRRADFEGVIADAGFPSDPFAQPSPMAIARATPTERKKKGEALIAGGRTLDAIPSLASAWNENLGDTKLLFKVAALQAWFHRDTELAATCRKAREFARGTRLDLVADSAAKCSSLLLTDHATDRAETLSLARLAYDLGKDTPSADWYRMGIGIAEYRAGKHEAAAETLRTVAGYNRQYYIPVTSAFYLAMSLSRQGKDDEARRVATEAVSRMRPLPIDENNPLAGGANHDDLILWMAYKEARTIFKFDSAPISGAEPKGK